MFFDMYQHENLFDYLTIYLLLVYLQTFLMGNHSVGAAWLRGKQTQRSSHTRLDLRSISLCIKYKAKTDWLVLVPWHLRETGEGPAEPVCVSSWVHPLYTPSIPQTDLLHVKHFILFLQTNSDILFTMTSCQRWWDSADINQTMPKKL